MCPALQLCASLSCVEDCEHMSRIPSAAQGVSAELHPRLVAAAAHAAGRYGHVMFPENAHQPALDVAAKLLAGVGAGWASRAFFSDDGWGCTRLRRSGCAHEARINRGRDAVSCCSEDSAYNLV